MTQVHAKIPEPTVPPVAGVPTVPVPETIPVIPLSDSPPPSRWKPGQKPWKPSYVNVQEIKANPGSTPPFPSGQEPVVGAVPVQTVATPKMAQGDLQCGYSPQARRPPTQRSPSGSTSGSSRGRSYSRSFSRSRSGGSSRSGSRSPHKHGSRHAQSSGSDSEHSSHKKGKAGKKSLEKEWKKYYSSLKRIKNLDKYISLSCHQSPNSGAMMGGEHSPNVNGAKERGSSIKEEHSEDHQVKRTNSMSNPNSRSEWDSDGDKEGHANTTGPSQKPNPGASEALHRKLSALAGWDSESDSEHLLTKTSASEKEEGEASSESEREPGSKAGSKALPRSPKKVPQPEKHRSKKSKRKHKRKRRGETKCGSGHPKDKAKRSKRKRHKLRETFHWQPPLEFGEEDDEIENQKEKRAEKQNTSGAASTKTPDHVRNKDHNIPAAGNNGSTRTPSHRREEQHLRPRGSVHENHPKEKPLHHPSSDSNAPAQTSSADDMDICTPEHDTESILEPPLNTTPDSTLRTITSITTITNSVSTATQDDTLHNQAPPPAAVFAVGAAAAGTLLDLKWKPLRGSTASAMASFLAASSKSSRPAEHPPPRSQGVKMEIRSKSRVRPGSLFDEVRKTARLNQRPRNQDSSSGEDSQEAGSREGSHTPGGKSGSMSSHRSRSRSRSLSYSRSRSRSRRSSSSSRYDRS